MVHDSWNFASPQIAAVGEFFKALGAVTIGNLIRKEAQQKELVCGDWIQIPRHGGRYARGSYGYGALRLRLLRQLCNTID